MSQQEMREPTFFVLASLADGRKHGYGIIKDAEQLSDGRVRDSSSRPVMRSSPGGYVVTSS
jgi:DNA-binding PadR family transcriptional regulator